MSVKTAAQIRTDVDEHLDASFPQSIRARLKDITDSSAFWALGNVADAGGDGVVDDAAAIQAALDAAGMAGGGIVRLPAGTYRVTSTLTIPTKVTLAGMPGTVIDADGVSGAIIRSNPTPNSTRTQQGLETLMLTGEADYGVLWSGSPVSTMRNVRIGASTLTHGFILEACWGSVFDALFTNGATISGTCCWLGADLNGVVINSLYTSNFCDYNLRSWPASAVSGYTASVSTGHGVTINNPVLQGGEIGLGLESVNPGGWTINSPYLENVGLPIKLGMLDASGLCRSVTINAPYIQGPAGSGPNVGLSDSAIDILNAINVNIVSPECGSWPDLIHYKAAKKVSVFGFHDISNGAVGTFTDKVKRLADATATSGINFFGSELGASEVNAPGVLFLKSDNGSHQHFKMTLDSVGAWVAEEVTPAAYP